MNVINFSFVQHDSTFPFKKTLILNFIEIALNRAGYFRKQLNERPFLTRHKHINQHLPNRLCPLFCSINFNSIVIGLTIYSSAKFQVR
jgi:hypothetical protein